MHTAAGALTDLLKTVGGLPTHPLVVHIAVVMLPLGTLALITIILVPRWRAAYGWLTMAVLAVGAAGGVLAAQTGEVLAESVGVPDDHARWGDLLEKVGVALFVVAAAWFVVQRQAARSCPGVAPRLLGRPLQAVAAVISVIMAIGVLGLTVVVGHSGATAVWGGRISAAPSSDNPPPASPTPRSPASASPTPSPASATPSMPASTPSPASSAPASITMTDVAQHATADSCWTVVDGSVYDLTKWIPRHPGGEKVIEAMCGTDASTAFHNQHDTQQEPRDALAEFRIGALAR
ncbi:MAG: cytochrome b5 domain-containing protein [Arachnia sp.]